MKKMLFFIPVLLLIFIYMFGSGYRFTAEGAAQAHGLLEKDAKLFGKVETSLGKMYIYKVNDYYISIVPKKDNLLWRAPVSTSMKEINDKGDKVKTIGWESCSDVKQTGTAIVIEVNDDKVFYIEAGPESDRVKKKVKKGEVITFEWKKGYFSHDIKPIALSEAGEKLYMYGYNPLTPAFMDIKELRWYKIQ